MKYISIVLILLFSSVLFAGQTQEIRFKKGKSSSTTQGSVIRGERDIYYITAGKGQKMTVTLSSLEENAVFQIYYPKSNKTVQGAGEMDDAKSWSGILKQSGKYKILVGPTRGNASYTLKTTIK